MNERAYICISDAAVSTTIFSSALAVAVKCATVRIRDLPRLFSVVHTNAKFSCSRSRCPNPLLFPILLCWIESYIKDGAGWRPGSLCVCVCVSACGWVEIITAMPAKARTITKATAAATWPTTIRLRQLRCRCCCRLKRKLKARKPETAV